MHILIIACNAHNW